MSNSQPAKQKPQHPKRASTKHLVRHILPSDNHPFVGRVFELSIVAYSFDSYEEMAQYPDVKYALEANYALKALTRRVESLNLAGGLIWPERLPDSFKDFAVSRHEWLTIAADVFLMRYISVVDCALILANCVYECGLEPKKCTFDQLRKKGVSQDALDVLETMVVDQGNHRGGSVCLNSCPGFAKWISALVMPLPGLASAQ